MARKKVTKSEMLKLDKKAQMIHERETDRENRIIEEEFNLKERLFNMYLNEGIKCYRDLNEEQRDELLAELAMMDMSWIANDALFDNGDAFLGSLIKDKFIMQVMWLVLTWCKEPGSSDLAYFLKLKRSSEVFRSALEKYYEEAIDSALEGLDEVPGYLDAVFKGDA